MRVLIAADSFKGSLSSLKVAEAVERGVRQVYPGAEVHKAAVADGGEGTVEAMVEYLQGRYVHAEVTGPLGEKITAKYGIIGGDTAIIEMAETSGLCLVPDGKRNPLLTTTYGTGELILDSINRGCRKIIIGIGGSATNDGGAGMASALGAGLTDNRGQPIGMGGGALDTLERIGTAGMDPRLKTVDILVACDVDNPLCGESGASKVFGPQKGATPEMIEQLDKNLHRFSEIIKRDMGIEIENIPGAGAAGGLGGGLIAFCGARHFKGIDLILDILNMDKLIMEADIVITGEGRIDGQTIYGKVPMGIAALAKKYRRPVFAITGYIGKDARLVYEKGIDSIVSAMAAPISVPEAMKNAPKLIAEASERLFRIIRAVRPEA